MDDVYQEEGERYMKKGILGRLGIAMCLCVGLLGTSTVYASPRADKYTSEFGTLHGEIEYIGTLNRRKNIKFSTTTTKKSPIIIAKVEILDYLTGERLDGDYIIHEDDTRAGYTCDCHSPAANSRTISAFGSHEARGNGSAVVYTSLSNLR